MSDISNEVVASGLDKVELVELLKYITGESDTTPAALEALTTNLYNKILTASSYGIASDTMRQARISRYLSKLEDELMDETLIQTMSREDLLEQYKLISAENNRAMENSRRWLAQNKDAFTAKKTQVEELAQQLSTLAPDKLAQVQKILSGESLQSTEETIANIEDTSL